MRGWWCEFFFDSCFGGEDAVKPLDANNAFCRSTRLRVAVGVTYAYLKVYNCKIGYAYSEWETCEERGRFSTAGRVHRASQLVHSYWKWSPPFALTDHLVTYLSLDFDDILLSLMYADSCTEATRGRPTTSCKRASAK